jgi:anti-sigma B factor antagonist
MTPAIPAPARPPSPTALARTPARGLPVARTAEPDDGAPLLDLDLGPNLGPNRDADPDDRRDTAVLRVRGEVDLCTVAHLRAHLHAALAAGPRAVVVDLRGVSFIDCTGIGVLADARCRARRRNVRLEIVPGRAVTRVATLLDLTAALGLDGPGPAGPDPAPAALARRG